MDSSWIFDAPPPPPSSSGPTSNGNARHGHGHARGQKRKRSGHDRDVRADQAFRPAMSLDTRYSMPQVYHNAAMTSSTPESLRASKTFEIGEDPPIEYPPIRHVSHVTAAPDLPAGPISYNEAGYALSSTYNAAQQNSTLKQNDDVSSKIPPPRIQGTSISLDTPEDIAAWIAERKKKWPTATNIENKAAQEPAKAQPHAKRSHKPSRIAKDTKKDLDQVAKENITPVERVANTPAVLQAPIVRVPKTGTSSLDIALAALSGTIELEQASAEVPEEQVVPQTTASQVEESVPADNPSSDSSDHSVSSSESESGSDSAEDDGEPQAISSKMTSFDKVTEDPSISAAPPATGKKRVCKYFRQGRCNRGEACTYLHEASTRNGVASEAKKGPNKQNVDDRYKWRTRKSLYERLVEQELEQEKEQERLRAESEAKADTVKT